MIKIRIVLEEDAELDPIDPSGEILISDGMSRIWQKDAYLDSWLNALIEGLSQVEAGKTATIDLVEEPDPLVVQPQNGGIKLTFREASVSVDRIDEFRLALGNAVVDFLSKFDIADRDGETELLKSIRKFSRIFDKKVD